MVGELPVKRFHIIHGDPTFSNTLVDDQGRVWLIDPRGSFGASRVYGDPLYDWAKLYYSVVGDYDAFNRRGFRLTVDSSEAEIVIQSNGWTHLESMFENRHGSSLHAIKLIHALIWISLCGYVRDDYDSVLGAFYNGLLWLERALE